jgi:hypothetical protein
MSNSGRLIPSYVEDWFTRGLQIWRLDPDTIKTGVGFRKAAEACFIGVTVAAVVEFLVATAHGPQKTSSQLWGLPVYAASQILAAIIFVLLLIGLLRAFGVPIQYSRAASMILYTLSGLIPVVMILSSEVLNHAIDRLSLLRDPSNPYFSASLLDLVMSEEASSGLRLRVGIEMLCAILFIVFYLVHLRKLLISCADYPAPKYRITLALLGTLIIQALAFRYLFGRIYWILLEKAIGV